MVAILKPYCLLHQKPKTSSRQQHESAKKENPQEPPYSTWAGEPGKISAPSSRRRVFSLDSPLYRTRLPDKWVPVPKLPVIRRNIKGRPFWSRVLSVRLEPLQKGTPFL